MIVFLSLIKESNSEYKADVIAAATEKDEDAVLVPDDVFAEIAKKHGVRIPKINLPVKLRGDLKSAKAAVFGCCRSIPKPNL